MAIAKRGKSWQVSVSHKGRRIRRSFPDYKDARKFEVETLADLLSGRKEDEKITKVTEDGVPLTFGGIADRIWLLEWSKQKSSAHTKKRLRGVRDYFGEGTVVTEITSYSLESYVIHLQEQGNGPATINRKLAVVSKIMGYAHKHGIINIKPTAPTQREPKGRVRYYSLVEEAEITAAITDDNLSDFFIVLIDTGMRKSEALGLEWGDVDFKKSEITLGDPDKIKSSVPRTIPMSRRVCSVISSRRESVFRPFKYTVNQMDVMLNEFKAESNYTGELKAFFHTCRHTFCSRLLQRGVPITTVKELAGHSDIKTTLRYAHLAPSNHRDAINTLESNSN